MIITVMIDTDNRHNIYAYNEDNSYSVEYEGIEPDEFYLNEIINDFLT